MKTKKTLNFKVRSLSGQADLQCTVDQLIMAGWVGRNREALQAHIDELAELGIPGPKNVPEFYPLSVDRLSRGASIRFPERITAGKSSFSGPAGAKPTSVSVQIKRTVLLKQTASPFRSRYATRCFAPPSGQEVQAHWDRLRLRAWIEEEGEEVLYQEGLLGEMLAPGNSSKNVSTVNFRRDGFVRRHHVGHRRSPAFGEIPDGTSRSRTAEKPGTWIPNRNPQRPGLIGNEDLNLFSGSTRTPMNASETLLREIFEGDAEANRNPGTNRSQSSPNR